VVVGPDFTEEQAMADVDDALRNVDNVYSLRDGRVLCCEDGWRGGNRSYPNDGLYVYEPPEASERAGPATGSEGTATATPGGTRGDEDDDETAESGESDDGTTTPDSAADGPGFGIGTGIAGLAGAGYLLNERFGDEDDEE